MRHCSQYLLFLALSATWANAQDMPSVTGFFDKEAITGDISAPSAPPSGLILGPKPAFRLKTGQASGAELAEGEQPAQEQGLQESVEQGYEGDEGDDSAAQGLIEGNNEQIVDQVKGEMYQQYGEDSAIAEVLKTSAQMRKHLGVASEQGGAEGAQRLPTKDYIEKAIEAVQDDVDGGKSRRERESSSTRF